MKTIKLLLLFFFITFSLQNLFSQESIHSQKKDKFSASIGTGLGFDFYFLSHNSNSDLNGLALMPNLNLGSINISYLFSNNFETGIRIENSQNLAVFTKKPKTVNDSTFTGSLTSVNLSIELSLIKGKKARLYTSTGFGTFFIHNFIGNNYSKKNNYWWGLGGAIRLKNSSEIFVIQSIGITSFRSIIKNDSFNNKIINTDLILGYKFYF